MNWTSGNPAVLDKSCYKKMRTCPAKYASNIVYYPKKRKPASSTMLRRCGSSSAMVWSDWWLEHKNGDSVQKNIPFHFEVILRWTRWTRRFGGVCGKWVDGYLLDPLCGQLQLGRPSFRKKTSFRDVLDVETKAAAGGRMHWWPGWCCMGMPCLSWSCQTRS